ncbi:MAG: FAD-dependent oxidoreductase [Porticoccaceae bacterium]
MELSHLFSPLKIGPMEIANRIMQPGMSAGMVVDKDLHVAPDMIAYYEERARSRPGMMAIGQSMVVPPTPGYTPQGMIYLHDDKYIPSLKKLVDAVQAHGVKFGIQLGDTGTQGGGAVHLSPSAVPARAAATGDARLRPELKALTIAEIAQVVQYFADAALRCKKAGFDFIEIHSGHGYLLSAFLTSYFNRRTDEYGGSLENRTRFLLEIVAAVRAAVGPEIGIGVKINGEDYLAEEGAFTIAECVEVSRMLERAGVDYLAVTAGVMGAKRLTIPPLYEPQACFNDLAVAVKQAVKIPVATIGRIKDVRMADQLVADERADIVCMGRAFIVDSEFVDKARRGDIRDIRTCLADCRGCADHEMRSIKKGLYGQTSCVLNPRVLRESVCIDIAGSAAANPRKVLVVGAGLAGLEAARRAAFSGHQVTLCENRDFIGGQIRWAEMIPGRQEIGDMLPWYQYQLEKHGVDVRLGTEVDETLIRSLAPDVLFVATGSVPQVPQHLMDAVMKAQNIALLMADDIFEFSPEVGDNVLVVGGDQIGMQVADYLSENGRAVTVAEAHNHFAFKLAANDRWYLVSRLIEKQVRRVKNVQDIEIDDDDQVWLSSKDGREHLPGIDTIVFASERKPMRALAEVAERLGIEAHVVGDAFDVNSEDAGMIFSVVAQAYDAARQV